MPDFLNDSLDDLLSGPIASEPRAPISSAPERIKTPELFWEKCGKCAGTGRVRWGTCFACKGAKGKSYKTSAADRAKSRQSAAERKQRSETESWASFEFAAPELAAWINHGAANGNSFANSLRDAVHRFGDLTEGQRAAVERCIARDAERKAEAVKRREQAPEVKADLMKEAFDRAAAAGLKRIRVTIGGFTFTPAKATSTNPGAIYVKQDGEYRGKIAQGRFFAVRGAESVTEQVSKIIADPATAARTEGRETIRCCCCNTPLENAESRAQGIGPICAARFGW